MSGQPEEGDDQVFYCDRCQSRPADRSVRVEALRTANASAKSPWCIRLCEGCYNEAHNNIKLWTQRKQTKFKFRVGDVVGVKKGCENGWPFRARHTVVSMDDRWSVPIYRLDGIDCGCPETILEAR